MALDNTLQGIGSFFQATLGVGVAFAGAVVTIRLANDADLPALTALYNHYIVNTPVTFDLDPFTVDGRREWFL